MPALSSFPPLPIDEALPALHEALAAHASVVLQAPPGAGKTTRVPLALLSAAWRADAKLLILEPRRLAARAAAHRMADLLGERVGETVGYRMRMDTAVGPRTRIEVVTEGVLTRMLQRDPALEGVALVAFDEYHERSLQADVGLALALQTQELLRPDLRLLVMSATLDGAAVAALLGGTGAPAPIVSSEGRAWPVETRWIERRPERVEPAVATAVVRALADDAGDVLVFLPGAGEIARVQEGLEGRVHANVRVHALHGTLPPAAQDAAIRAAPAGERKVVLATSIAETSLTIDGVRIVVDSGLARVPRFSPRSGMTRLETIRASRASVDQRRGRAGRQGPGVCHRLWSEAEEHHLVPHAAPEITEADLAPLALELAAAGVRDPAELRWLDAPPAAAYAQARELLAQLGALDADGRLTEHGRRMAALPLHPRLAHMILAALPLGLGGAACAVAALLGDRDVLRGEAGQPPDVDLRLRLELLLRDAERVSGAWVHREGVRRARAEAQRLRERVGAEGPLRAEQVHDAGLLLAFAYPDRVAQRRAQPGRFLLRNGRGAMLAEMQSLARDAYLVAADLDGREREARIWLAAPVTLEALLEHERELVTTEDVVEWDDDARAVVARRRERLGALVLRDVQLRDADPARVASALLEGVRSVGIAGLPWSDAARSLRARLAFARTLDSSWPDVSDDALMATLDEWLAPHLEGLRKLDDLSRVDLAEVLRAMLAWPQRAALDTLAPTHVVVPSGSRLPVDYAEPSAPVLAVRLQELFGLAETPRVGGGRVPLTLHLLSPAHRPVQVTRDLAGFWRTSYFDVRRDMRGRYPKHHWPENPLEAQATNRAKRRGES